MSAAEAIAADDARRVRGIAWAGFWLGFGLAMFFDGILLHQILQWHHLLSGVAPGETVPDLRFQVLADGVFHLITYTLTVLGLWLLWANRSVLGAPGADRRLVAFGLIGFGVWHLVDAVLSHWLLGIHRIRMDVDNPLLWDLIWVIPFGIGALVLGLWLLRRPPPSPGGTSRLGRAAATVLACVVVGSGVLAARPPAGVPADRALVVFRPDMGFADIVAASAAAGGHPVWSDEAGGIWLVALEPGVRPSTLYRHGALLVSNGPVAVGCLNWIEI